jgi:branched-chain amino acid transport system permease protein
LGWFPELQAGYMSLPLGTRYGHRALLRAHPGRHVRLLLELCLRRTYGRDPLYGLLLTFGAALVIEELIRLVWGSNEQQMALPPTISGAFLMGDLIYSRYRVFASGFAILAIAALWLFLEKTPYGAIIKAGAHDSEMVRALGINLSRLRSAVFALGVALAAIAGVVMAPIWGIRPHVGVDAVVPAFLIIVLGGVGSLWGAVIAGLLVGLVVGLTGAYASEWSLMSMYLLFIAVVTFRSRGLFRQEKRSRHMTPSTSHTPPLKDKIALVTGAGGTMGRAVVAALIEDGCRVGLIDVNAQSMAPLEAMYGDAVVAVACDISDPGRAGRAGAGRAAARADRRAGQQRRHLVQQQDRSHQPGRMAARARRQPRRRDVLGAGRGAGHEGAALGPHHQHQLARGQDRRADRRHSLCRVEGRHERADLLAGTRAGAVRRHRQRHRARLREDAHDHRAAHRSAAPGRCSSRSRSAASASRRSSPTRCAFSHRRCRASSPARSSTSTAAC